MKKNILIAVLLIAFATTGIAYAYSFIVRDNSYIEIAGTISPAPSGWRILQDSQHAPMNITGVTTEAGRIKIEHEFDATQVVTFIVTTDETMTKEGYRVGISGGLDFSFIYIYKDGAVVSPITYQNLAGNIWIYGLIKQ
jgi:hypothetical protein